MAAYQLRFASGLTLKDWLHQLALRLAEKIPLHYWVGPQVPPTLAGPSIPKGVRVILISKSLREGLLAHLQTFDLCGTQAECDEACQPAKENRTKNRNRECHGLIPVERYLVRDAQGAADLAGKLLMDHVFQLVPYVAFEEKPLLAELKALIADHLFINDLCGVTDLCKQASPKDLKNELMRDPGPDEA